MNLQIGTVLRGGTYKIEKVLGQGSFGITYLAMHTGLNKRLAIKEFFMKECNQRDDKGTLTGMTEGGLSYNYCKKFQKEANNLAHLEHNNIVRVTDLFEENGTFYYVMEYIEGQNLDDYIKSHRLNEKEAVDIILQVASALEYMHDTHHMLHLDLKPGNIMRRESDGKVFLIDFGLSKHYEKDGHPETSTTVGLGTPGYAPIEQANQARNGEFRPTIDVYALGATLYKLLTGERPLEASVLISDPDAHIRVMQSKGVNPELMGFVVKSMLPNMNQRIANMTQFKQMLASIKLNVNNPAATIQPAAQAPANDETQVFTASQQPAAQQMQPEQNFGQTDEEARKKKKKKRIIIIVIAACLIAAASIGIAEIISNSTSKPSYKSTTPTYNNNTPTSPQYPLVMQGYDGLYHFQNGSPANGYVSVPSGNGYYKNAIANNGYLVQWL